MKSCTKSLLMVLVVGVAGCGDSLEALLRDELVLESENLDRITLFVRDEASAKEYNDVYLPMLNLARGEENLGKRREELVEKLSVEQKPMWNHLRNVVFVDIDESLEVSRLKRWSDIARDVNVMEGQEHKLDDPRPNKDGKTPLGLLPTREMLKAYALERIAFRKCQLRETKRLKGIIDKLAAEGKEENSSVELQKTLDAMDYILRADPGAAQARPGRGGPGKFAPPGPGNRQPVMPPNNMPPPVPPPM